MKTIQQRLAEDIQNTLNDEYYEKYASMCIEEFWKSSEEVIRLLNKNALSDSEIYVTFGKELASFKLRKDVAKFVASCEEAYYMGSDNTTLL